LEERVELRISAQSTGKIGDVENAASQEEVDDGKDHDSSELD
jgi:hypothetical protein